MCYVSVLVMTMLVSPEEGRVPVVYAESMSPMEPGPSLWDRLGLWATVAAVLILIVYAKPLYDLHTMVKFGSRGFSPF
jgi:hypothetical protein